MPKILETERLTDVQTWAAAIRAAYARTVESVIAVGRELIAAKTALPHGEFERMVRNELPFKERTAQMFISVANSQRLCSPDIRPMLPNALSSLYELSRVEDDVWQSMIAAKAITTESTTAEIVQARDLHLVIVRGARPKPPAQPFATVIPIKPLPPYSNPAKPPVAVAPPARRH